MKPRFQQVAVLLLCAFLLVSALPIRSTEADYSANKYVSGSSADVTIFYVTTESQSNCKIKFSATKGTMNIISVGILDRANYDYRLDSVTQNKSNDTKQMYEYFSILVQKINMQKVVLSQEEYLLEDSSETISLEKDSHYRIIITPLFYSFSREWVGKKYHANLGYNPYGSTSGFILNRIASSVKNSKWLPTGWNKNATWEISSTKGVAACTVAQAIKNDNGFNGTFRVIDYTSYYGSEIKISGKDFDLELAYQNGNNKKTQTLHGIMIDQIYDTCSDAITYVALIQSTTTSNIISEKYYYIYLEYDPEFDTVLVGIDSMCQTTFGGYDRV